MGVLFQRKGGHNPEATDPDKAAGAAPRGYDADEHVLGLAELRARLQTALDLSNPAASVGLSVEEAQRRLARDGPNTLSPPRRVPEILQFLSKFLNPLMVLLSLAGVLCFVAYGINEDDPVNKWCGIALVVIVIVQSTLTYLEEKKSGGVMESLRKMVPAACSVVRDGQPRRVPAAELVVGDVVQLKGGDRVPADLRIVQTSGLKVECSSLTGEPDALEVTVTATHDEPHESRNLTFSTSQCTEGSAYGVVIRTADRTLIGMLAGLTSSTSSSQSTLQVEVSRVVFIITCIASGMSIAILIIGLCQKVEPLKVITIVMSIFVANIPQGLPATVTSCLSIAAKRMLKRNVLVKRIDVIETLGSASCICSDKTGTLTQNRMTVQNFWFNGSYEMLHGDQIIVSGTGGIEAQQRLTDGAVVDVDFWQEKEPRPSVHSQGGGPHIGRWSSNPLEPLLLVAAVCNSAKYAADDAPDAAERKPGPREIIGDASEAALMRYCDAIYPVELIRQMYPRVFDLPFNSTNKYALCVVEPLPGECPGKQLVFMKGAPEVVLDKCTHWLQGGVEKPIGEEFHRHYHAAYERFAQAGERVLGFARRTVDSRPAADVSAVASTPAGLADLAQGFTFLGLTSLMDPPKPGVDRAVLDCHQASIRVFMVTGDHALTAEAIARNVNIITKLTRADLARDRCVPLEEVDPRDPEIEAVVVTGSELRKFQEQDWDWLLPKPQIVFARTTPQQKLEIVEHLQRRGEIVAVTGDGVNDSPALKQANIGVAMGNPNASDVAREAADMIILDDDFCSIVNAIKEGRLLFDNLKKSIAYTLSHLMPEMVPVFLNVILLFPLGLSALLILSIDLGSELVPAISLAYEEPESAIMQRRPRNTKTERLVTPGLIIYSYVWMGFLESGICMLAYFWVFWHWGIDLKDLLWSMQTYFSPHAPDFHSGGRTFTASQQMEILSWANGAWYTNIIVCQVFHIWFCRTRATSVFSHSMLSNRVVWMGIAWELCFVAIFVYIPGLAPVFVSGLGLPAQFWLPSLGFLVCVASYTELVKWAARRKIRTGRGNFLARLSW